MSKPVILSTWSFGRIANAAGWGVLSEGGNSLDAVEQGCRAVEADPSVNTVGYGSIPDASGKLSLDGAIMQSPDRCGGVCFVRKHMYPVTIARRVMEMTDHVMLAGKGADEFGSGLGMPEVNLLTAEARQVWDSWRLELARPGAGPNAANIEEETAGGTRGVDEDDGENLPHNIDHDTVGVLALDGEGVLSGACSTSGLRFKVPGRVGDSPPW